VVYSFFMLSLESEFTIRIRSFSLVVVVGATASFQYFFYFIPWGAMVGSETQGF
jgi:hypothetical protein